MNRVKNLCASMLGFIKHNVTAFVDIGYVLMYETKDSTRISAFTGIHGTALKCYSIVQRTSTLDLHYHMSL